MTKKKLPIECGEGWHDIVWACHRELFRIDPDYQPLQIKEKFGGLRYYFNSSHRDKEIMNMVVDKYEKMSFTICEECGEPGTTARGITTLWIKTLCAKHRGIEEDD